MLVVAAKFIGKPERRLEVLLLANAFVPPTRAEQGCISCSFYELQPSRNQFLLFEEWTDMAALEAHFRTPHFLDLMKHKPELIEGQHEVSVYEVAQVQRGMMQVLPSTIVSGTQD